MSKKFTKRLAKFISRQGRQLPKETRNVLNKRIGDLNPEEKQWYAQNVEPYLGFISSTLETIYLQEGKPDSWAGELAHDRGLTILEQIASEVITANRPPEPQVDGGEEAIEGEIVSDGDTLNVKPGAADDTGINPEEEEAPLKDDAPATVILGESSCAEEGETRAGTQVDEGEGEPAEDEDALGKNEAAESVSEGASAETVLLKGREEEETEEDGSEGALVVAPPTVMLQPAEGEKREYGLVQASYAPGVAHTDIAAVVPETAPLDLSAEAQEKPKSWLKRHRIAVLICAVSVIVAGTATFLTVFFLTGRRQLLYEWSRSDRIGYDLRVERALTMEKNVGESPFRFTVDLKVENLGRKPLAVLQVEEQLPRILSSKGKLVFNPETNKGDKEEGLVAWEARKIRRDETFVATYCLPLEAELSRPQLDNIEEHFSSGIIAFIGLPENHMQCGGCEGAGNITCQGCAGAGSSVCAACGGGGGSSCSSCGGRGTYNCSVCAGYGYYWRCTSCGRIITYSQRYSWSYCYYCTRGKTVSGPYNCSNCAGTGTATCSSCGGSGRRQCSQCGGSGRLACAACGGSGKVACQTCQGSGQVAFTYGESKVFAAQ